MLGSPPDLLRLVAVPVFAWAAWRDVRTRRLPNRLWPPLFVGGVVLLIWEALAQFPFAGFGDRLFALRVGLSLFLVAPLGYVFWRLGGFGGADAKALIVVAVVFPTYPTYLVPVSGLTVLPLVESRLGVFSLTILTNAVLVGLASPLALGIRNALAGRFSAAMFLARVEPVSALSHLHGRLFETRDGFTRRGLDLDALRMYLRWRGATLAAVRADPERFRDPASVAETHEPTDGAVHVGPRTDGGVDEGPAGDSDGDSRSADAGYDDPWAAERFLRDVPGDAYGTTPEMLREGLETVVERDRVWVSPGIPFIVPLFVGLVLALTFGDVLFALLRAAGLA